MRSLECLNTHSLSNKGEKNKFNIEKLQFYWNREGKTSSRAIKS